jgi:WD40 repeat protein
MVCRGCGSNDVGTLHACNMPSSQALSAEHKDLVRSVALGEKFVVSGSYDKTIKVWDRQSGTLVADLAGGHIGRILCVAFDKTKVVSCGEDYVCVSRHDRITDVIDGYLAANMCLGFRPWG